MKPKTAKQENDERPLGYSQCEWVADGERCRYPGSISRHVNGHGPWYCGAHDRCGSGPLGAQIVEASFGYRHATMEERDARYVREVLRNSTYRPKTSACEARGCIAPATPRPSDGRYLCRSHRMVGADELAKRLGQMPSKCSEFLPPMREPGEE